MASSEPRPPHRRQIPGTFVFNWQSSDGQGIKPLIRRPVTACEACRNAKVKCNGKRQCDRCRSRGNQCTYATGPILRGKTPSARDRALGTPHSQPGPEDQDENSKQTFIDLSGSLMRSPNTPEENTTSQANFMEKEWQDELFNDALAQFDWEFADEIDSDITPSISFSTLTAESVSSPRILLEATSTAKDQDQSLTDSSLSTGQHAGGACSCRSTLMDQIPYLDSVMQEQPKPRLDKMFKVTKDIILSCNSAANCANCQIGPVDLVYILAMFQQTAFCFNQIAKSGIDDSMNIKFGDYQIQLNDDPKFKNALILDLIKQGSVFLDTTDELKTRLFLNDSPSSRKVISRSPACLNQLNLAYAQETTDNFRKLFRLMTNVFEGKGHDLT